MSVVARVRSSVFVRHNAVFFIGSLGVAALNYLYYPVLGRLMSPADFGEVQTLVSIFTQVTIFLGILTYVTIHVTVNSDDQTERNQTLLALEHVALLGGGVLLGLSLLLTGVVQDFLQLSSGWPFVALIAGIAISIPLLLRMAYLRGSKLFIKASLTDGIGSATKLVLSPLFVLAGLKSFGAVTGLVFSQVISLIFGALWAYRAGLKEFGIKPGHLKLAALRPQLRYALSVFLVSGSIITITSLDMLAIKHYFPPDQAGLYAGVATVARIIFFLTTPFTGVLLTMVSLRQPKNKNARRLKGSLALTMALGGAAVLFIGLLPDFTTKLLVSAKYLPYSHLLPKLCLAMLLLGIANTLLMYQVALKRYACSLIPLGVTFFTLILLFMRHNAVAQIVDGIVGSSVVLLVIAGLTSFRYALGEGKHT